METLLGSSRPFCFFRKQWKRFIPYLFKIGKKSLNPSQLRGSLMEHNNQQFKKKKEATK